MPPRVLVVSQRGDVHVERVATALLRAGAKMELLDLGAFPRELSVAVGHDAEGCWRARLINSSGAPVALDHLTSIWWRRPTPYLLHDGLPAEYGAFAMAQLHEAMVGVWTHLEARWINPPWADQAAGHKLRQLELAGQVGLLIPRTVVTTSPAEARAFLEGLEGRPAILKVLAPTAAFCPYTRLVTSSDLQRLDALRLSPVILQEYVPGVDLRVTAVCQELFTAEIDARATSAPHDFRQVQAACSVEAGSLPPQDEARILALMGRLGLAYGALDFRRAEDGRLVFLEVNPGGQWLFVEERTGLPISSALAGALCRPLATRCLRRPEARRSSKPTGTARQGERCRPPVASPVGGH